MKILCVLLCSITSIVAENNFQLILEPKWHNLESNTGREQQFGGKWILIGSITFRKKIHTKDDITLTKLYLHWKGEPLTELLGSLYRKNNAKEFLPIQENLLCDGAWNKKKQTLKLTFDQEQTLGLISTFYLVLTVPSNLEPILRRGRFELEHSELPEVFRTTSDKLSLCLDAINTTTTEIPIKEGYES